MIFVAELTIRIVAYHWNFLFGDASQEEIRLAVKVFRELYSTNRSCEGIVPNDFELGSGQAEGAYVHACA